MGASYHDELEEDYKGYSVITLPNQMKGKRNEPESGLFEDAGSCFILVTHTCLGKLTSLPFPAGPIVEAVEEVLVPIAHPVEGFTLRLLAAIDALIYAAITTIEGSVMSTSERVHHVLTLLHKRGILGMSADFWVQYESSMRERLQRMIELVNRIPLVAVATPFVCRVSAPLVNAMSDWLLEHSQSQDKTIQFHQYKEGKESDAMKTEPPDFEGIDKATKDVKEDEKTILTHLKKGEETKAIDVKKGEEAKQDAKDANVEKAVKEEEIVERKEIEIPDKQNDTSDVSAVLEMIDSGWLSPRTLHAAPTPLVKAAAPPASNPKKHGNSKSKRGGSRR